MTEPHESPWHSTHVYGGAEATGLNYNDPEVLARIRERPDSLEPVDEADVALEEIQHTPTDSKLRTVGVTIVSWVVERLHRQELRAWDRLPKIDTALAPADASLNYDDTA